MTLLLMINLRYCVFFPLQKQKLFCVNNISKENIYLVYSLGVGRFQTKKKEEDEEDPKAKGGMKIYDLNHEHPLDEVFIAFHADCGVCLRPIRRHDELIYGCFTCFSYFIHLSCANEMPYMICHSLHEGHTLSPFFTKESKHFQCFSCRGKFDGVIVFSCSDCECFMCIQCALKPDISTCEGQNVDLIPLICHEEPMTLEEKNHEDGIKCYSCQLPCSGPTYTCKTCKYFFHKSCMELPPEIQLPLHPHHPLKRHFLRPSQTLICKSCHKHSPFIVFQCNECKFNLCPECTSLKPTIKHQQHNHLLCLVDNKDKYLDQCDGFGTYCRQVAVPKEYKRYVLRCVECDFNLHLLCGRLPCFIKHECHMHSLNFTDSVVEDSWDEYFCDVCEEGRDARLCIYYCADCNYKVHLHCVLYKVIQVLEEDVGDAEFRMVGEFNSMDEDAGQTSNGRQDTLKDLIKKLSHKEIDQLKSQFEWNDEENAEKLIKLDHQAGGGEQTRDDGDQFSPYTNEDIEKLYARIYTNSVKKRLKIESWELALKIVNVEGFEIPKTLVPVLKDIIAEYGYVPLEPEKDELSPAMRSILCFILCPLVDNMFKTKIIDITEDLFYQWDSHCKFFRWNMGLSECANFLRPRMNKFADAYIGLQVERRENDISTKLPKKIEELREKLKRHEEQLEKFRESKCSPRPDRVEECVKRASQLNKWKNLRDFFYN